MKENLRPAVMAVIFNLENKVLIGSSPRDGGFKFPQGGRDKGETPLQTIKRELKEELDLEIEDKDIIFQSEKEVKYNYLTENIKGFTGQKQFVFKIKYRDDMKIEPQDEEFDKLIWIKPNELNKYDFRHRLFAYREALILCGLLNK